MTEIIKRRKYYIKKSTQRKFILRFALVSAIGGVLAVGIFNVFSYRKIDSVLYLMRLPKISAGGLLLDQMLYVNLLVALFIIVVFSVMAKRLFTRMSWPLKKLRAEISKISKGDLNTKVEMRSKDEFHDFAREINDMSGELRKRFLKIKECSNELSSLVENFQEGTRLEDSVLDKINEQANNLKQEVLAFKMDFLGPVFIALIMANKKYEMAF